MATLSHSLFPQYRYSTKAVLGLVRDGLLNRHRSFRTDSAACIARLTPPLQVYGNENIPSSGPCLVTFNHYSRPGFNAWWIALAVASQLPMDAHFVITNELTFPGKWYAPVARPLSRWVLKRIAATYGFTSLPPMPPREKDVEARAFAVREVFSYVEYSDNPLVCLAPEGADMPGGKLAYPPPGGGRFMLQLAAKGLKVIPVSVWEQDGFLNVKFGLKFELLVPSGKTTDERDLLAATAVMRKIALLLPVDLRGEFQ